LPYFACKKAFNSKLKTVLNLLNLREKYFNSKLNTVFIGVEYG